MPAAVAILPPAMFKVNWKGMFLYGPDLSCALTAIGGLAALTGLLRVVKARRSLPGQPPARRASFIDVDTITTGHAAPCRHARNRRSDRGWHLARQLACRIGSAQDEQLGISRTVDQHLVR